MIVKNDPITLQSLQNPMRGHIIGDKFRISNKCVIVEKQVDNFFGNFNEKLYNYLDYLDGRWRHSRFIFNDIRLRADVTFSQSEIQINAFHKGGIHVNSRLEDHMSNFGSFRLTTKVNKFEAHLCVLHSVFLSLVELKLFDEYEYKYIHNLLNKVFVGDTLNDSENRLIKSVNISPPIIECNNGDSPFFFFYKSNNNKLYIVRYPKAYGVVLFPPSCRKGKINFNNTIASFEEEDNNCFEVFQVVDRLTP